MKSKLYAIPLLAMLLVLSVATFASALSLRGNGGSISYIGSDSVLTATKIHFSASEGIPKGLGNPNYVSGLQSRGSLEIIARDNLNKRVVLNVDFKGGYATYWKQGVTPRPIRVPVAVTYNYDSSTGLTDVMGVGGINFLVQGIPTSQI